jgi:hypothetical protein
VASSDQGNDDVEMKSQDVTSPVKIKKSPSQQVSNKVHTLVLDCVLSLPVQRELGMSYQCPEIV